MSQQSVVWLDRKEARITHFANEKMERKVVRARHVEHHTHRVDDQLEREVPGFFEDVAANLADASSILILGPGVARKHFETFLYENHAGLARRIVGSETVDHPSDPEIAAFASRYFMRKAEGV